MVKSIDYSKASSKRRRRRRALTYPQARQGKTVNSDRELISAVDNALKDLNKDPVMVARTIVDPDSVLRDLGVCPSEKYAIRFHNLMEAFRKEVDPDVCEKLKTASFLPNQLESIQLIPRNRMNLKDFQALSQKGYAPIPEHPASQELPMEVLDAFTGSSAHTSDSKKLRTQAFVYQPQTTAERFLQVSDRLYPLTRQPSMANTAPSTHPATRAWSIGYRGQIS